MRILLTNDDGIYAKGIEALYLALENEHEVMVVAPETERSAVGHAITYLDPLRVKSISRNGRFFGYAVDGYPADCVKLAVAELLTPPPEIVVSGINLGANLGVNVIYSGTVSAATEASVLGIPSVAVSLDSLDSNADFSIASRFTLRLLDRIEKYGFAADVSLNVNVPNLPEEDIQGVRITRQGNLRYKERYDRRMDPRNHVYYWLCSALPESDSDPDSDYHAVVSNYISITPIHFNLTCNGMLDTLRRWDFSA